jgi:acetyltransferase-like isoleucine patch superfamily enzyme
VRCEVDPDARFGRRVRFHPVPGSHSVVRLGARCTLGDDVRVDLHGGELVLGPDADVGARCVLRVGGRLEFVGPNLVQHGCTLHCVESVWVGPFVGMGEYVTVIDSSHTHDGPSEWFVDDVVSSPVVIGAHAWVGAKATVTRGVHVGERSIVGANSTVVKDVPAGQLASGVPAVVVRPAVHSPTRASQGVTPGRRGADALSSSS